MAFVTTFICPECRRERHEVVVPSRICVSCRTAMARVKEDAHMQLLASLPLEERVRRIELALYRLDAGARLDAIEQRDTRYS